MKSAVLIQARTDSSRFPNKVLQPIEGKPMLWHVIERCKRIDSQVIVATTDREMDDALVNIANECQVSYFRGSRDDVLDRYYKAALEYGLDVITRITGDCPLIDPKESSKVLEVVKKGGIDFAGLDMTTYPDGLDTESFTFDALKEAWLKARLKSQREHVTPYIWDAPTNFRRASISSSQLLGHLRWTVDYPDDLEFVRKVYQKLYQKNTIFCMEDVLELLRNEPNLLKINLSHKRNEGYAKSLREDGPAI